VDEVGPYREGPQWRICPRCEEALEEIFAGCLSCPRCAGTWVSQVVLDAAFGDPMWPGGAAMWWRRSLNCPECASGGSKTMMDAVEAHGVIVDRCAGHGMWFDDGELERCTEVASDPLSVLRDRVSKSRPEIEAARASYDRRRSQLTHDRQELREQAEEAARREPVKPAEYEPVPARIDMQRREIEQAIAKKSAELVALKRQVDRLESDLATLQQRLSEVQRAT
jgi:Zn-finger nucleic acid-binding protein